MAKLGSDEQERLDAGQDGDRLGFMRRGVTSTLTKDPGGSTWPGYPPFGRRSTIYNVRLSSKSDTVKSLVDIRLLIGSSGDSVSGERLGLFRRADVNMFVVLLIITYLVNNGRRRSFSVVHLTLDAYMSINSSHAVKQ